MAESRDFVLQQLNRLGPEWGLKIQGRMAWIRCPFHADGQENTPSMAINVEPNVTSKGTFEVGSCRCHGCGKFLPRWGFLAKALRLVADGGDLDHVDGPIFGAHFDKALMQDERENGHVPNMDNMLPWSDRDDWRTVKGKLLVRVGAKLMFNEQIQREQLYLPCYVNGEHIGGVRANLKKQGKRNYFNTDGPWVRNSALYPYDYVKRMIRKRRLKTVVPVEGARDALKAIQFGIPALGILGTGNWSEEKADLLLSLGVERIITAFDPDKAGTKATAKVYASLKDEVYVRRFQFPDDTDPGSMTPEIAARLKKHII
jgi:hypothetical protein